MIIFDFLLACECNVQGSLSDTCDMNGKCQCKTFTNCNVTGTKCDNADDGCFGFPTPKACQCDLDGSVNNNCHKVTGHCDCNPNVQGELCDECKDNHYDFPNCKPCRCDKKGSKNKACNIDSGDCDCHRHVVGQKCDQCQESFFGFPDCKGNLKELVLNCFNSIYLGF